MGGFSAAYDLVSNSYGWTDNQIGELTLGRFRQIVAAIRTRELIQDRNKKNLIGWSTRALAVMIAGGYMIDSKDGNPAVEYAASLAIDAIDAAMLEDAESLAPAKSKEPELGSYERFMTAFGGKLAD